MSEKELLRAVGGISDDLILEASGAVKKSNRIRLTALVLAAALAVLTSLTALAAGVVLSRRNSHVYHKPQYTSLPSADTLMRDIGIAPRLPERFSNGYAFSQGNIAQNEDYAEDGVLFESYQALSCYYKKDGERIYLSVDAAAMGTQIEDDKTAAVYRGSEIKYTDYLNKFVPPGYQLTEDEKSGACGYLITYGSAEIELRRVQLLGWEYGGLNYDLCAIDSSLDKEALVQMAKEIIDLQGDTK